MRALSGFYDATLNRGLTPAQAIAANPSWQAVWKDEPTRMYGRPMRYYQQLQALDVERAWAEVTVPTLIVWGENDWIMGRVEAERAAAILRARDPALVTLAIRPEMDHQLFKYKDAKASIGARGGVFDDGMAKLVVEWLRAH